MSKPALSGEVTDPTLHPAGRGTDDPGKPDSWAPEFWAAVAIVHSGQAGEAYRVNVFPYLLRADMPPLSPSQRAGLAAQVAASPTGNPDEDYGSALMLLRHVNRVCNPAGPSREQARALLLGVHAGMAAEELWACVHGAPWPPEDTLLTLGALRDPAVAAALAAASTTGRPA